MQIKTIGGACWIAERQNQVLKPSPMIMPSWSLVKSLSCTYMCHWQDAGIAALPRILQWQPSTHSVSAERYSRRKLVSLLIVSDIRYWE